ncbi:MAG: DUF4469 domain-containing protein [Paludibacteraceae bacterium]|nr:DUF4469 domain-containing protein [Paludibacteraceae bacterium]
MSTNHRTIKAILYRNSMKNANGKYLARTSVNNVYNIRAVCESACRNTLRGANPDAMEYLVKTFFEEMTYLIENGEKINTGYFSAQANVKGVFNSPGDRFDNKRHKVEVAFSTGAIIRRRSKGLKAEVFRAGNFNFRIGIVFDAQTKEHVDKLIANRLLVLKGEKLKIVGDDPSVGIYLVHSESGQQIHLPAAELCENTNATLKFFVPDLQPGAYELKVCTQYAGSTKALTRPCTFAYSRVLHAY